MRVLITGANRGLGYALTELLTDKGNFVLAGMRRQGDPRNLLKIQQTHPDLVRIVTIDVCDEGSIVDASKTIDREYGCIDVIINNAGVLLAKERRIDELDLSEIRQTFETNTFGPYAVIKYFLPLLYKGRNQCIINISSEAGSLSTCFVTQLCSYHMSKAALNMMTQMFSNLLEGKNIRIFAVHPGRMNTDMNRDGAQIEPMEAAIGIYDIITGNMHIKERVKFVDYLGHPMPL